MIMMIFWNLNEITIMNFIKIYEQRQFEPLIPKSYLERERVIHKPRLYIQISIFFYKNMKFKFSKYLKYLKCKEGERDTNTQRERKREAQQ